MLCMVVVVAAVILNVTINSAVFVTPAHVSQAGNVALSRKSRHRLRYSCRPPSPPARHLMPRSLRWLYLV